jgi:hypothetical protein
MVSVGWRADKLGVIRMYTLMRLMLEMSFFSIKSLYDEVATVWAPRGEEFPLQSVFVWRYDAT